MHRLATISSNLPGENEGVIFLNQTPAPLVFLTAADTDIQTFAAALPLLPSDFPALRVANLLQLQQQISIDDYAEQTLAKSQVIIIRLLGGRSYWSYGLEVVKETVEQNHGNLIIIPGDDRPDPDLISHSTLPPFIINQIWSYFNEGGPANYANVCQYIADLCLGKKYSPAPPKSIPRIGYYGPKLIPDSSYPQVAILFYRAHYLAGNLAPIDALCQALVNKNLQPIPIFISSLREAEMQTELLAYFQDLDIKILLNTTSFAVTNFNQKQESFAFSFPTLQVILSSGTQAEWESKLSGLSPRDVAINVALPEVDGRIITRAISFKQVLNWHEQLETDVLSYLPQLDRIEFVVDLAANYITLQNTPINQRKIALILANYPTRDGRLANGVGLDTPASCIEILKALETAGYYLENIPETGEELIKLLTKGVTNDGELRELRQINQFLPGGEFEQYFQTLPSAIQEGIKQRWEKLTDNFTQVKDIPISGIQLGNIFIGIQPSRGYDLDPSLNYHAPDLEPTPAYLGFYYWLRQHFNVNAIIHVGKHGNLEWLPGKSVALSDHCYPEIALLSIPHFYPFIVNDPGEGAQAKRRSHSVIIDHLTPPLTRAELYGSLLKLENLVDEYYEAESLDPSRLKEIRASLNQLIIKENLHQDLGLNPTEVTQLKSSLPLKIDSYLCELKEAQIRDGLHIFGQVPQGEQLRDLIISIARYPSQNRIGLTRTIAQELSFDFDPLTAEKTKKMPNLNKELIQNLTEKSPQNIGDLVALIEEIAAQLVDDLISDPYSIRTLLPHKESSTEKELNWIKTYLLPSLEKTTEEITNLLKGLDGKFIPSGPSGAPTRGRPDVLPTGRNFYSVDIRAIPTETAYRVGKLAAEALIERYTQENGNYPRTIGLSIWGTSTMRTGGDDLAQALALLGVQPVWDGFSRRVIDLEILPTNVLGRPRVDVTLRISGFFRDAFPNLIELFDKAVKSIAALDEPEVLNPLAAQVKKEVNYWEKLGLSKDVAQTRSLYRIFGAKPGAYGAGLQGLIEAQNWQNDQDLAAAYMNWSSYAYSQQNPTLDNQELEGISARESFEQRLAQIQIVLHNQDNREHDLLDSDDYYQFQGGMTVAIRALTGQNPLTYFGDNSIAEKPKVKHLREEIAKVYRSRVINPKWIAGVMRHGYKGAFEMAATVDYLFAYDATANCVEDFMYQGVAEAYIFDEKVHNFIQRTNPWALRDMTERLLEANQRGLWQDVNQETLDKLRLVVLQAEGSVENY